MKELSQAWFDRDQGPTINNPNVAKGWAAGAPGLPGDLYELAQALQLQSMFGAVPVNQPNPFPTTDSVGQAMGADVSSPGFIGGSVFAANPLGPLAKVATAIAPLAARSDKFLDLFRAMGSAQPKGPAQQIDEIKQARPEPQDYEHEVKFNQKETPAVQSEARVKTTGQYRGAPRGVASPQKLGGLRRELDRLLEKGVIGRDWYDKSARSANELTGGRRDYKHLYTGTNAVTSRDTAVPVNQIFGVKGYNQAITGKPIDTGRYPSTQSPPIEKLARGEEYVGGPKETPFYQAQNIDDFQEGVRPTNDLWMARAFRYKRKNPKTGEMEEWGEGLGEAQHRFMDQEINEAVKRANEKKIGGHDDWTPEKVQAAIWVAKKSEYERIPVERAAHDFSDKLDKLTSTIRYEATPSTSLSHRPGVSGTDAYQDLVQAMIQNDAGQDLLALDAGALTRTSDRGEGIYNGVTSPSSGTRILTGPATNSDELDPASSGLLRALAAVRGMNLGQDTAGMTSFRPAKSAGRRNIARVPEEATGGRSLNELAEALSAQFGEDAFPLHAPGGHEIVYTGKDGKAFKKGLDEVLGNRSAEYGRNSAPAGVETETPGLVGSFEGYKPSAYMKDIDAANLAPEAMARLERGAINEADTFLKLDRVIGDNVPDAGQADALLTKTWEILSSGGFEGVRKAVQQGILPAIVLSAFVASGEGQQPAAGPS